MNKKNHYFTFLTKEKENDDAVSNFTFVTFLLCDKTLCTSWFKYCLTNKINRLTSFSQTTFQTVEFASLDPKSVTFVKQNLIITKLDVSCTLYACGIRVVFTHRWTRRAPEAVKF